MLTKTTDIFLETLYRLLHKFKFENITIDQIVKKSGLSKATFYRCYNSKYELFESLFDQIVTTIVLKTNKEMNWRETGLLLLNLILDNNIVFINAWNDNENTLQEMVYKRFLSTYSHLLNDMNSEQLYVLETYLMGTCTITVKWIKEKTFNSAEKMMDIYEMAMPEIIKESLL
nr:TetR/AcrR family transcriptional regulator [uncultured Clostridium sp.]